MRSDLFIRVASLSVVYFGILSVLVEGVYIVYAGECLHVGLIFLRELSNG